MYTYSKLKEALIGSGNSIPRDWSPNAVRALVIGGGFIFVAYHTRQPKFVALDTTQVIEDLNKNGSTGSLGNLLKQRQLSCLEEIYVDSVYTVYKGALNLEDYVNSLINSRSRLRYWGYISGAVPDELLQRFSKAQIEQLYGYSYAKDNTRTATVQYTEVDNSSWYTKYNLRPEKYAPDVPNGVLSKYFTRVEGALEEYYSKQLKELTARSAKEAVVLLYNQDYKNFSWVVMFMRLMSFTGNSKDNNIIRSVNGCVRLVYEYVVEHCVHIGWEDFVGYLSGSTKPVKGLNAVYQKVGMFSKKNDEIKLDDLVNKSRAGDGLLGFKSAFVSCMPKYVGELNRCKNDAYLMLICILTERGYDIANIPEVIKEIGNKSNWFEEYVSILTGMCGHTIESLSKKG